MAKNFRRASSPSCPYILYLKVGNYAWPNITPDPISHLTQYHTWPNITPDPISHLTNITPDPIAHLTNITPDPISHLTNITPDPIAHLTQYHTWPNITPDPISHLTQYHTWPISHLTQYHTWPNVTPDSISHLTQYPDQYPDQYHTLPSQLSKLLVRYGIIVLFQKLFQNRLSCLNEMHKLNTNYWIHSTEICQSCNNPLPPPKATECKSFSQIVYTHK